MAENIHYTAPMSLTERVDALTQIAMSLTKGRDEMVSRLAGIRQLAQDHAEKVIDAAARNIEANTGKSIEELCKVAAMDLEDRFNLLTSKQQVALTSRADAIEKRILAERQKAVTLADVRPELESLVAGAIESRRVELSKGADNAAQEAVKVALASMDVPFSKMVFKGQWDPSATYSVNDVVYYRGGSFVALQSTQQLPAAVSPDWQQIAAAGARGPAGNDGDADAAIAAKEAAEAAAEQTESDRIAVEAAAAIVIPSTDLNAARNAAAPRQGVMLDAANNVTLTGFKLGFSDFTLVFPASRLSDYSVSDTAAANILFESHTTGNNRVQIGLRAGGSWRITFTDSDEAVTTYDIPPSPALVDDSIIAAAIVFNRAGNATLFVNGVDSGNVSISAAATIDIGSGNSNSARLFGGTAIVGDLYQSILYNFALTSTQIADRYASGVWVPAEEQNFSSYSADWTGSNTDGWAGNTTSVSAILVDGDGAGVPPFNGIKATSTGSDRHRYFAPEKAIPTAGNYYVSFRLFIPGGSDLIGRPISVFSSVVSGFGNFAAGDNIYSGVAFWNALSNFRFIGHLGSFDHTGVVTYMTEFTAVKQAATINLQPQGLGRQLLDVSANRNHGLATSHPSYTQPANSCVHKITVANGTGSATNTNLAGGLIQPANTYIESIRFIRTAGTGAFQIGTASAEAQVVASTSADSGIASMVILRDTTTAANVFVNMAANTTYDFILTFAKI